MRPKTLVLLLIWVVLASPLLAQENGNKAQAPLTNTDVASMLKDGLSAEIVVAKIKSSPCALDTSPKSLAELKNSGVPESVILAMVQAPIVKATSGSPSSESTSGSPSPIRRAHISCDRGEKDVFWYPASDSPEKLNCGETVSVLEEKGSFYKVKPAEGKVGDVSRFVVYEDKPKGKTIAETVGASSTIPPNTLRAIAWRGVPWVTTSYYQQQGSATTDCMGSGTWYGNMSQSNVSCSTQYTPAQSVPINWTHYTVYNLVETSTSYMVLTCTRNWAFSKCSYLIPGNEFPFDDKGGKVSVTGQRGGKSKEQTLTFDLVSTQSK